MVLKLIILYHICLSQVPRLIAYSKHGSLAHRYPLYAPPVELRCVSSPPLVAHLLFVMLVNLFDPLVLQLIFSLLQLFGLLVSLQHIFKLEVLGGLLEFLHLFLLLYLLIIKVSEFALLLPLDLLKEFSIVSDALRVSDDLHVP